MIRKNKTCEQKTARVCAIQRRRTLQFQMKRDSNKMALLGNVAKIVFLVKFLH